MDSRPHKSAGRLQVFEEITRKGEAEASHSLWISGVLSAESIVPLLSVYGELMQVEMSWSHSVRATFFDIRHASAAYFQLKKWCTVHYAETNDYLLIPEAEFSRLENYRALISKVDRLGSLLAVHFFDLRILHFLTSEMNQEEEDDSPFFENEFHDNSFIGSEISLNSESTLPSPYVYITPESESSFEIKKNKFSIDLENVGKDPRTTIMIKNIPNKYTEAMLLEALNRDFAFTFDFFYLPIDFKNKCNMGYAFINFLDCKTIPKFHAQFNGKKWERFNSEKICALAYARIQGRPLLLQHFQSV